MELNNTKGQPRNDRNTRRKGKTSKHHQNTTHKSGLQLDKGYTEIESWQEQSPNLPPGENTDLTSTDEPLRSPLKRLTGL